LLAVAVIEYKAQSGGILALRRVAVGSKIVAQQILGVQVSGQSERQHAPAWLAHVERMARAEQRENERLEKMEEAESDVVDELERNEHTDGSKDKSNSSNSSSNAST